MTSLTLQHTAVPGTALFGLLAAGASEGASDLFLSAGPGRPASGDGEQTRWRLRFRVDGTLTEETDGVDPTLLVSEMLDNPGEELLFALSPEADLEAEVRATIDGTGRRFRLTYHRDADPVTAAMVVRVLPDLPFAPTP